jgi:hypothetical protein
MFDKLRLPIVVAVTLIFAVWSIADGDFGGAVGMLIIASLVTLAGLPRLRRS